MAARATLTSAAKRNKTRARRGRELVLARDIKTVANAVTALGRAEVLGRPDKRKLRCFCGKMVSEEASLK